MNLYTAFKSHLKLFWERGLLLEDETHLTLAMAFVYAYSEVAMLWFYVVLWIQLAKYNDL